ncbi:hypothetical protein C8R42DRAFT_647475 [Lentinula raphanica]|nr:hypothetical protein C8R42DRAFT_647475 [Lentinula raphanica]
MVHTRIFFAIFLAFGITSVLSVPMPAHGNAAVQSREEDASSEGYDSAATTSGYSRASSHTLGRSRSPTPQVASEQKPINEETVEEKIQKVEDCASVYQNHKWSFDNLVKRLRSREKLQYRKTDEESLDEYRLMASENCWFVALLRLFIGSVLKMPHNATSEVNQRASRIRLNSRTMTGEDTVVPAESPSQIRRGSFGSLNVNLRP